MDIKQNIKIFLNGYLKNKGKQPDERYASFDYCYNYFQSFREKNLIDKLNDNKNIHNSCLQIGFYLASWGMLRGSSFLLEKSVGFYKKLIEEIAIFDKRIWEIDVDNYDKNIDLLLEFKEKIKNSLGSENRPTDTLITKIMLGVFANIPAYDNYFRTAFKTHSFGKKSLKIISEFYDKNQKIIDSYDIKTFDFITGKETQRKYTKAKIIDMIGFIEGSKNSKKQK